MKNNENNTFQGIDEIFINRKLAINHLNLKQF